MFSLQSWPKLLEWFQNAPLPHSMLVVWATVDLWLIQEPTLNRWEANWENWKANWDKNLGLSDHWMNISIGHCVLAVHNRVFQRILTRVVGRALVVSESYLLLVGGLTASNRACPAHCLAPHTTWPVHNYSRSFQGRQTATAWEEGGGLWVAPGRWQSSCPASKIPEENGRLKKTKV